MNPTEPRPTPRRRRWQWLLVCGVLGLVVCVFLGGLLLDEPPPEDHDLEPKDLSILTTETVDFDAPVWWPSPSLESRELRGFVGLRIEDLGQQAAEQWSGNPELTALLDELRPTYSALETRIHGSIAGGVRIEFIGNDDGIFNALPLLARLEWVLGHPSETLRWTRLDLDIGAHAMATAERVFPWGFALRSMGTRIDTLRVWVELGLLHAVPDLDPDDLATVSVSWERGVRLLYRAYGIEPNPPDGFPVMRSASEVASWRWKPNRFQRRLGESLRPLLRDPTQEFEVDPDPIWIRWWIDPYGTEVLGVVAAEIETERS